MSKYCFNCGNEIKDDSKFCMYCGLKFDSEITEPSKSIAEPNTGIIEKTPEKAQQYIRPYQPIGQQYQRKATSQAVLNPSEKNDVMISIFGAIAFFVLTVGLQLISIFGGFLKAVTPEGTLNFMWNGFEATSGGITANISYSLWDSLYGSYLQSSVWSLLPISGPLWIIGSLIGTLLLVFSAVSIYSTGKLENKLPLVGFLVCIISAIIEYGLFILIIITEDWAQTPQINILYFLCYIIGLGCLVLSFSKLSDFY